MSTNITATDRPSPNGYNRDNRGRFAEGNPGGPGNPLAKRTAEVKQAFLNAVTPDDVGDIARKLVEQAKAGDTVAARIVLDRILGRDSQPIELALSPAENHDGYTLGELVEAIHAADDDLAALVEKARAREMGLSDPAR